MLVVELFRKFVGRETYIEGDGLSVGHDYVKSQIRREDSIFKQI